MPRTPGQRAGLTRDAVLTAARTVFAERGLPGLSMRSVARELDVAPNALYSHVADKDALVDDLLDDLLGALDPPAPDAEPLAGLRGVMLATFDLLVVHADLVPLYLARQGARGENARALGAAMTVLLGHLGLDGDAAGRVVRALVVSTIGYAALATADGPALAPAQLRADLEVTLDWLLLGATRS
ncbi:TetR/AcrR family transcriptional regulator [Actinomycetospora cinnamomea]|uniref:TetR family transcriptional regulator n=1 Tax=Actinomycetospora cinnamomea TaxID=663609 RepID=A0A2U1F9L3_9PSEU|nr:helix-turn-helix domain-containing protein [Actinomycetospora cinnamomea]PVZ08854.1 TetR family transcriptional regulator [Actinomycetospora cinnamomea]